VAALTDLCDSGLSVARFRRLRRITPSAATTLPVNPSPQSRLVRANRLEFECDAALRLHDRACGRDDSVMVTVMVTLDCDTNRPNCECDAAVACDAAGTSTPSP